MSGGDFVNGQPATRIFAKLLKETEKAYYCDCEGDMEWFPKSAALYMHDSGTLLVQDWLYDQKGL